MAAFAWVTEASGQGARRRWELQRQIRLDKFEQVLPVAMRNNRNMHLKRTGDATSTQQ